MTQLVIDKVVAYLFIWLIIGAGATALWGITSAISRAKPLFVKIRRKFAIAVSWYFFPDVYKAYKGGYLEK